MPGFDQNDYDWTARNCRKKSKVVTRGNNRLKPVNVNTILLLSSSREALGAIYIDSLLERRKDGGDYFRSYDQRQRPN